MDRLSNTVCQTLGIKIATRADLSKPHKMSPKLSPSLSSSKDISPRSTKCPPLTNGIRLV